MFAVFSGKKYSDMLIEGICWPCVIQSCYWKTKSFVVSATRRYGMFKLFYITINAHIANIDNKLST